MVDATILYYDRLATPSSRNPLHIVGPSLPEWRLHVLFQSVYE